MKAPDFWNDKRESEKTISTANSLKDMIDKVKNLKEKIESNFEMIEELRKSYDEELVENKTCAKIAHMGNYGKQTYNTKYYNLDMIIFIGFRVNSKKQLSLELG